MSILYNIIVRRFRRIADENFVLICKQLLVKFTVASLFSLFIMLLCFLHVWWKEMIKMRCENVKPGTVISLWLCGSVREQISGSIDNLYSVTNTAGSAAVINKQKRFILSWTVPKIWLLKNVQLFGPPCRRGTLKMRDMKLRDMKMRHYVAGVENARHENAGRSKMQRWKMRDMNLRHQHGV